MVSCFDLQRHLCSRRSWSSSSCANVKAGSLFASCSYIWAHSILCHSLSFSWNCTRLCRELYDSLQPHWVKRLRKTSRITWQKIRPVWNDTIAIRRVSVAVFVLNHTKDKRLNIPWEVEKLNDDLFWQNRKTEQQQQQQKQDNLATSNFQCFFFFF